MREKLNIYKWAEAVEDTRETTNGCENNARNPQFRIRLGRSSLYYSGGGIANLDTV